MTRVLEPVCVCVCCGHSCWQSSSENLPCDARVVDRKVRRSKAQCDGRSWCVCFICKLFSSWAEHMWSPVLKHTHTLSPAMYMCYLLENVQWSETLWSIVNMISNIVYNIPQICLRLAFLQLYCVIVCLMSLYFDCQNEPCMDWFCFAHRTK